MHPVADTTPAPSPTAFAEPRPSSTLTVCVPTGVQDRPRHCTEHVNHPYCATCDAFYAESHVGWHDGPSAHPRSLTAARACTCAPCLNRVAEHDRELANCAVLTPAR